MSPWSRGTPTSQGVVESRVKTTAVLMAQAANMDRSQHVGPDHLVPGVVEDVVREDNGSARLAGQLRPHPPLLVGHKVLVPNAAGTKEMTRKVDYTGMR